MLPHKDIPKTQEIKALFKQTWKQPEFFSHHLKLFKFTKTSQMSSAVKKSGIPFSELVRALLTLPFMDIKNVSSLFGRKTIPCRGKKDAYHRALSNQSR